MRAIVFHMHNDRDRTDQDYPSIDRINQAIGPASTHGQAIAEQFELERQFIVTDYSETTLARDFWKKTAHSFLYRAVGSSDDIWG